MSRYYRSQEGLGGEYVESVYGSSSAQESQFRREVAGGEEVVERLGLKVVYEDPEILVVTAPNEDELKNIILNLLREKPMSVKEIHSILAGIASEDKIRRSLMKLAEEGIVSMDEEGRYRLLGLY